MNSLSKIYLGDMSDMSADFLGSDPRVDTLPDSVSTWRAEVFEDAAMACLKGRCSSWDLDRLANGVRSVCTNGADFDARLPLREAIAAALPSLGSDVEGGAATVRRRWPEIILAYTGLNDLTGPALLTDLGWHRFKQALADFESKAHAEELRPERSWLIAYSRKLLSFDTLVATSMIVTAVGVIWIGWVMREFAH